MVDKLDLYIYLYSLFDNCNTIEEFNSVSKSILDVIVEIKCDKKLGGILWNILIIYKL